MGRQSASYLRGPKGKKAEDGPVEALASEDTPPLAPSPSPLIIDKSNWQGFCDIESDPAYFSVILRDMGVKGVAVREVFTLDPEDLQASLPQPIHGLILLFHYREFGNADQPSECPANVWFANQLPAQNSCATLAMINILMNTPDVSTGEHLDQFKAFTRDLTPFQRGEALASFDFVKRIHNSFAKKMDILESDKHLAYKVAKAQRLKAQSSPPLTKKRTKSRRASADSSHTNDSAEFYEQTGHHFIAFVPIGNQVWKLDGLDAQPTSVGTFTPSPEAHPATFPDPPPPSPSSWLSVASATIATLMSRSNGDDDYGIIALTPSPLVDLRKRFCTTYNALTLLDTHIRNVDHDWNLSRLPSVHHAPEPHALGISPADLLRYPAPPDAAPPAPQEYSATATTDTVAQRYQHMVHQLHDLGAQIAAEVQAEADDEAKALQRRFDGGPAIQTWLAMLAENGHLERHLHRFMPLGGRARKK